jgi:hypothetical protein
MHSFPEPRTPPPSDPPFACFRLTVDMKVPEVEWAVPGETAALAALQAFLARMGAYDKERNDPSLPGVRNSGVRQAAQGKGVCGMISSPPPPP